MKTGNLLCGLTLILCVTSAYSRYSPEHRPDALPTILELSSPAHAAARAQINPDSGIVINWTALDLIAGNFAPVAAEAWLPPVRTNCTIFGLSTVNEGGLAHERYRPLFCPWFLKPYRDAFDLTVTEAAKWPVYRQLMGAANVSVGLPVAAFFGGCVCGVYANATQAYEALSAFDPCWYSKDELQRCNAEGHAIPHHKTALTAEQYSMLLRNASYADEATPHL